MSNYLKKIHCWTKEILLAPRLSVGEKTLFAKRLSFLLKAGVSITESLEILQKQTKSKPKIKIYESLIKDVSNGKSLSTSLKKFNEIFGGFIVSIVKVGESSGILEQNLQYLAQELEKQQILRRKVLGALVYPVFITTTTILVTTMLIIYIFPKLMPIFTSLHVPLPFTTRFLIFISHFLKSYGYLTIAITIVALILFFIAKAKFEKVRIFIDNLLIHTPLFGKMVRSYNVANITRTFGLLMKSGIKVVESCDITGETTKNLIYKRELENIAKGAIKGEKISKCLDRNPKIFPEIASHMIAIGEKTGNLPETMLYLSGMYEAEIEEITKNLSSAIEPALMAFMGLLVGFVAISVITPIYEITQHLQH